jgi:hypothetical protein
MVKWEYKCEWGIIRTYKLNELGNEGWELIAVERNDVVSLRRYFFKRIKQ